MGHRINLVDPGYKRSHDVWTNVLLFIMTIVVLIVALGCGFIAQIPIPWPSPKPSPSASPSPSPTPEPSPTPTPKPSPSPTPVPSPTPTPVPSPSPTPVPTPSPSPSPSPTPPPGDDREGWDNEYQCPQPERVKLGFRAAVKKQVGYRNTFDVTPMVLSTGDGGSCEHKRHEGVLPSECAAFEACGVYYNRVYGEVQAYQRSTAFSGAHPVERQSNEPFILVIATNHAPDWQDGAYKLAGRYTIGVSYPFLKFWRIQNGLIDSQGKALGFGPDRDGENLNK